MDATSPHAIGVDIPVVKDVIFDLASSLDASKLQGVREEVENKMICKNNTLCAYINI